MCKTVFLFVGLYTEYLIIRMMFEQNVYYYFTQITTLHAEYLIPTYFKYVTTETKHKLLNFCIKNKWYAGIVECIKHIEIPPSKMVDIVDLFILDDKIKWIDLCIQLKVIDITSIEPILLFYGTPRMYEMYCKHIHQPNKNTHLHIVNENIDKVKFILSYLATNNKDKEYYTSIEKRCKELQLYLLKHIN